MFNAGKLLKLQNAWSTFTRNHPKFPNFLNAVYRDGLKEGSIIEINVTTASGQTICSNLKLTESDMQLFHELSQR